MMSFRLLVSTDAMTGFVQISGPESQSLTETERRLEITSPSRVIICCSGSGDKRGEFSSVLGPVHFIRDVQRVKVSQSHESSHYFNLTPTCKSESCEPPYQNISVQNMTQNPFNANKSHHPPKASGCR